MSDRRSISTAAAPAAIGPYSQAIAGGGFLFLSGQIALDPERAELVSGGAAEQCERCMANIGAVLEAAGSGFGDIVRTTIYLTDLRDFADVNRVYGEHFDGGAPPARSTVQVAALPLGARVEVDAIAVLPATAADDR